MSNHFPSETLFDKQMHLSLNTFSKMRSVTFNYAQPSPTIVSRIQMQLKAFFTDGNKKGNALFTTEA